MKALPLLLIIFTLNSGIISQERTRPKNQNKTQIIDEEKTPAVIHPPIQTPEPIKERRKDIIDAERTVDHHREQQRQPDVIPTKVNTRIPDYSNPELPHNYSPPSHDIVVPVYHPGYTDVKIIYTSEKERGIELLEDMDYYGALQLFLESLKKNSKDIELYYLIGATEISLEYYDDALNDLNYYLSFFDDDGEAYYQRGLAKLFLGSKAEAQKDLLLSIDYGCIKANQLLRKYF